MGLNNPNQALEGKGLIDLTFPYPKIYDDFEDGDVAEYSVFNSNFFGVDTSRVNSGTYAVRHRNKTGGTATGVSTSGLDKYPQKNTIFEVHFNVQFSGGNWGIGFAVQSESQNPDGYFVHISDDNNEFNLQKIDGGTSTKLAGSSQTYTNGIWYRIEIDWQDTISAKLYDDTETLQSDISSTDTTFTSGGIASTFQFGGTGGSEDVYWDDYQDV